MAHGVAFIVTAKKTTLTNVIYILINTEICSLSIVLTTTDQKPQKIIKKVILPTITLPECQRDAE